MGNEYGRSRSTSSIFDKITWMWVGVLLLIIVIVWIARSFTSGNNVSSNLPHLSISPDSTASTVFIAMTESSKNRIIGTGAQSLYVGDRSASVETGGAHISNDSLSIDLDEKTELSYVSHTGSDDTLKLSKGRIWLQQVSNSSRIEMKNMAAIFHANDIAILEQTNQIYSTIYAIRGDITISTTAGDYIVKTGNRLMISASDLANPTLSLATLVGPIDGPIVNSPVFIKNNGKSFLQNPTTENSGSTTPQIGLSGSIKSGYISIIEPLDGSVANSSVVQIHGTINSKEVKKVTINDMDSVISPVNGTFMYSNLAISDEINNLVYKAYGDNNSLLEKGVIIIFGSKQALQGANKLIPTTSPITNKDFTIISPTTNPYIMSDHGVKVQGTVAKDTVSYILVNDYRLQKYIAGSTSWYYFANVESGTLKDGINLYTIKFFSANNDLLYTQLFTIIKESKNATISGESSR